MNDNFCTDTMSRLIVLFSQSMNDNLYTDTMSCLSFGAVLIINMRPTHRYFSLSRRFQEQMVDCLIFVVAVL